MNILQSKKCFSDLTDVENTEILEKFKKHANYLHETFSEEKQNAVMVNSICRALGVHPDKKTTDDIVLEFD